MLPPALKECAGKPLRGPNDLTLDAASRRVLLHRSGAVRHQEPDRDRALCGQRGEDASGRRRGAFSNGIVLTPDGKTLYVAESQYNRPGACDRHRPRSGEKNKRLLVDLPKKDEATGQIDNQPDGMCLDGAGNLYVAHYGMRQVQVVSPEGKIVAHYPGGNLTTSNVAFGGAKRKAPGTISSS